MTFDTEEPKKEKTWFDYAKTGVIILMVLIIIIVPVSCFIPNSPTLRWILHALEWLQSQPLWLKGTLMVLILALGIPIGGPVTPLELCSGFIFGFWLGSLFAGIGMTLGAIICFFWGKYLLIEWSEQQQREKKLVRAICYAVRKEALKLVVLCRLSPILPTFMMNYLFATTGMSFGIYLLGSILGDFPWVFAYCYIGSLSKSLADAFNDSGGSKTTQIIFLVVGITATAILLVVVTYIGKREIKKAMDELDALDQESIPLKSESQTNYTSTNAYSPLLSGGSYGSNDIANNNANFNSSYNNEDIKRNYDEGADLLFPQRPKKVNDEKGDDNSSPFAQSAPLGSGVPFESSMPISSPSFFAQSAPLSPAPFSQSSPLSSAFSQSSPLSSPFAQSTPLSEPLSSPFSQSSPLSLSSPFSQSSPLSSAFSQSTPLPSAAPNVYVAPVMSSDPISDHSSNNNNNNNNNNSHSDNHSSSSHSSLYSSSHHDGGSSGGDSGGGGGD